MILFRPLLFFLCVVHCVVHCVAFTKLLFIYLFICRVSFKTHSASPSHLGVCLVARRRTKWKQKICRFCFVFRLFNKRTVDKNKIYDFFSSLFTDVSKCVSKRVRRFFYFAATSAVDLSSVTQHKSAWTFYTKILFCKCAGIPVFSLFFLFFCLLICYFYFVIIIFIYW